MRAVNADAEGDDHADVDENAGDGHNAVVEDNEEPGVGAYRAKRAVKLRKNEVALRLKVKQW
jgi:hypothetical protein